MRSMLAILLLSVVLPFTFACSTPTAPSAAPRVVPATFNYTINVPDPMTARQLQQQHPQGIVMAPIDAQTTFDYSAAYHGSPNVYYGPMSPLYQGQYQLTGILVCPVAVAQHSEFYGSEWPAAGLDAATLYQFVGMFVYTAAEVR